MVLVGIPRGTPKSSVSKCISDGLERISRNRFNPVMALAFVTYVTKLRLRDGNQKIKKRAIEKIVSDTLVNVPNLHGIPDLNEALMRPEYELVCAALEQGMRKLMELDRDNRSRQQAEMDLQNARQIDRDAFDKQEALGLEKIAVRHSVKVYDMDDHSKEPQELDHCGYLFDVRRQLLEDAYLLMEGMRTNDSYEPELWIPSGDLNKPRFSSRWWTWGTYNQRTGGIERLDAINAYNRPYYVVVAVHDGVTDGVWPTAVDIPIDKSLQCCRGCCETLYKHLVRIFGDTTTIGWIHLPNDATDLSTIRWEFPNRSNNLYVQREGAV